MEIALSVSDLVLQIKELLEGEFRQIQVEGELSNLSTSATGHWYFTLSDKESGLSCALFKMDALRNPIIKKLKDGDKLCCFGKIGVYQKRGSFQLIVERLLPVGKGDLQAEFERLKSKLAGEGLFDLQKKRPLPSFPKRVAIITAEKGAALQDFLNVFKRRSFFMDVLIVPALVQGEQAPTSLISALKQIESHQETCAENACIDVVVLARGGGSLEDLWAFNDEKLARAIAHFPIPTISAVGHQVDFTIADFVADKRCETPTAAAETLTEEQMRLGDKMSHLQTRLNSRMTLTLTEFQRRVSRVQPHALYEALKGHYQEKSQRSDEALRTLQNTIEKSCMALNHRLTHAHAMLGALNPKQVLGRGFCFLQSADGKVIENKRNLEAHSCDEDLKLEFVDGASWVKRLDKGSET